MLRDSPTRIPPGTVPKAEAERGRQAQHRLASAPAVGAGSWKTSPELYTICTVEGEQGSELACIYNFTLDHALWDELFDIAHAICDAMPCCLNGEEEAVRAVEVSSLCVGVQICQMGGQDAANQAKGLYLKVQCHAGERLES